MDSCLVIDKAIIFNGRISKGKIEHAIVIFFKTVLFNQRCTLGLVAINSDLVFPEGVLCNSIREALQQGNAMLVFRKHISGNSALAVV